MKRIFFLLITAFISNQLIGQPGYGGINGGDAPGTPIDNFVYVLLTIIFSVFLYMRWYKSQQQHHQHGKNHLDNYINK